MNVSAQTPGPTPTVDLVFDAQCPNLADARVLLRAALMASGLPPVWREWERDRADTPAELRGLGSPTILVDGVDVSGMDEADTDAGRANACRVYDQDGWLRGVPPLAAITTALARSITSGVDVTDNRRASR